MLASFVSSEKFAINIAAHLGVLLNGSKVDPAASRERQKACAMGFVPGFEFDVFISYCHIDNLRLDDVRWVEQFHERLEIGLWQREGRRQIRIWRDRELDGSQKFDQTLAAKLANSAILLCLHSPGYRESEYCLRERHWFRDANENRLYVGDRSRVFNVLLYNIPPKLWPDVFQGRSGFPFFNPGRAGTAGYPLPIRSPEFTDCMHGLADALFTTLQTMQQVNSKASRAPAAAKQRSGGSRPRVYLAKVSDALATRRKRIIADLGEEFEFIEAAPPPFENPAHDETVEKRMNDADLCVHLLDQYPGMQIPGEVRGHIQRQVEIGSELARPQLIWVPKDLILSEECAEPEEAAYRTFVNQVETATRAGSNYDFIRGMASDIATEIRDRIQRLKPPPSVASQPAVLLDVHYKDHPHVTDLYRYLAERGIQPLLMPEQDDPRASEGLFVEQLKRVSGMIVFFGQVALDWVMERLYAAAKIKTTTKSPVKTFGIYVAPPQKGDSELMADWGPFRVHSMDNSNGFDPASLEPMLKDLSKPPGAPNV